MTHYSLVKKTTLITLDMLNLTSPKWPEVSLILVQIWFFLLEFLIWKTKNLIVIEYFHAMKTMLTMLKLNILFMWFIRMEIKYRQLCEIY
jgi:hypothetical protein